MKGRGLLCSWQALLPSPSFESNVAVETGRIAGLLWETPPPSTVSERVVSSFERSERLALTEVWGKLSEFLAA